MTYGVVTSNRALAERVFSVLERKLDPTIKRRMMSRDNMCVIDNAGNCIQWIRPLQSARGYKFDEVYVDMLVDTEFVYQAVLSMSWRHGWHDIFWIADKRTMIHECFIKSLQPSLELVDTERNYDLAFYKVKAVNETPI